MAPHERLRSFETCVTGTALVENPLSEPIKASQSRSELLRASQSLSKLLRASQSFSEQLLESTKALNIRDDFCSTHITTSWAMFAFSPAGADPLHLNLGGGTSCLQVCHGAAGEGAMPAVSVTLQSVVLVSICKKQVRSLFFL